MKAFRLLVCTITLSACAFAQLTADEANNLIQRFRPYLKTSIGSLYGISLHTPEQLRPASWQWFMARATLVSQYVSASCGGLGTLDPPKDGNPVPNAAQLKGDLSLLLQEPGANLSMSRYTQIAPPNPGYAFHLDDPSSQAGEPWSDVVKGDGFYAHAEEILDAQGVDLGLVNIEYTIFWAYNSAICDEHNGDVTTLIVVYDRNADLITRVTYDIHGGTLVIFRIANPDAITPTVLRGQDDNGVAQTIAAVQVEYSKSNTDANLYQQGKYLASNVDPYLYMAQDPATLLYEHPVAYAEYGGHELWPNTSGKETSANAHPGDGFSFLPDAVQMLGTPSDPIRGQEPFVFYNGLIGTDPQTIMLHKAWYWPAGRDNNPFYIPADRFKENDPYQNPSGSLPWAPAQAFQDATEVAYVKTGASTLYHLNDAAHPFPDIPSALSFLPAGGSVLVSAGTYPAPVTIGHPCVIEAPNGAVVLGAR